MFGLKIISVLDSIVSIMTIISITTIDNNSVMNCSAFECHLMFIKNTIHVN